ncbi:MAG: FkbM family methyltransferase [Syntrophales bacterium]|nr:FkbM family methyltransferase [Syntrophales bacterium]MDD5640430.1 FkbM family methyltransferase [Syntrophales bacterium]
MSESWLKAMSRELFRWYLNRFPLRDGKAYFYERFHPRLLPEARLLTISLDKGFRLQLDLRDIEQRKIYFFGHYHERYEANIIESLLHKGEIFWDVGANIGYFTLVAAGALKDTGQIVSFEPGKEAFARLQANVALNPFHNILIQPLAVADKSGEAVLYLSGEVADSGANLYRPGKGQTRQEICATVSLDQFCREQGLRPPDFIKMDVEGAELAALKGAENILAQARPLLLLEMEEKTLKAAGTDKAAIARLLQNYGYQAAFLRKGRWYATAEVDGVKGRNVLWFDPASPGHRQKCARVPVRGIF